MIFRIDILSNIVIHSLAFVLLSSITFLLCEIYYVYGFYAPELVSTNVSYWLKPEYSNSYSAMSSISVHKNTKADTTIVLSFKNLSTIYNYKIIDRFYFDEESPNRVKRSIVISNKVDSVVQKIYPKLNITPWCYNWENGKYLGLEPHQTISRSYTTGKNIKKQITDNYCGEIVVADLNFDGLEDFATPVDCGASNGSHYQFYIQNQQHEFVSNKYLTEEVMWFPEKINDSLKTFTRVLPGSLYFIFYKTYTYDTLLYKWRVIKSYSVDIRNNKTVK
ncbi:MAG: hypothetical protein U0Y96_15475 [Candidatus Kapaibacterium sp.]